MLDLSSRHASISFSSARFASCRRCLRHGSAADILVRRCGTCSDNGAARFQLCESCPSQRWPNTRADRRFLARVARPMPSTARCDGEWIVLSFGRDTSGDGAPVQSIGECRQGNIGVHVYRHHEGTTMRLRNFIAIQAGYLLVAKRRLDLFVNSRLRHDRLGRANSCRGIL